MKKSRGEQKTTEVVLREMLQKLQEVPKEKRNERTQKEIEILSNICDTIGK